MLFGFFRQRRHNQAIVARQYAALTGLARVPAFYSDMHVPDTVMGRFEMLSIVMILFFRRTRHSDAGGQQLAQGIVDAFFEDIDHSIRELGIGDQGVPKRMKKLAGMFYGRLQSYSEALDRQDDQALAEALRRNIYPEAAADAPDMDALAAWMKVADDAALVMPEETILTGTLALPSPERMS